MTRRNGNRRGRSGWWTAAGTLAALAVAAMVACGKGGAQENDYADVTAPPPLPPPRGLAKLPEGPYPGIAVSALEKTARNPYTGDSTAVRQGDSLFLSMNCAGCHGWEAKTGIFAPNLTDNYWRYGGSDADVFNSIYEGRARGMPAWGGVLSQDQIWKIVAYINSLGGMTGPRVPSQAAHVDTTGAAGPTPANKRQP